MKLGSKEHSDVMAQFEKEFYYMRRDREKDEKLQKMGAIYESGETNALFDAYRRGYSFASAIARCGG